MKPGAGHRSEFEKLQRKYVIRRFIAVGQRYVVDEKSVTGWSKALLTASYMSDAIMGVAVIDPDGQIVRRFGRVPNDID